MKVLLLRLFLFLVASVATAGSLYFSEIRFFTPCKLCWLQRIFMYPLVLLAFMGLFAPKKESERYILPLSLIGMGISLFHVSLEHKWFGLNENSCSDSLCSMIWVNYFGIFTIPTLALTAFTLISLTTISLLMQRG